MTLPKIAIVVGTTRPTRFADKPANWIAGLAAQRTDAEFEIVDLRDHDLPLFAEKRAPIYSPPEHPAAVAFCERMKAFDGYIFVTGEYNHSIGGALKNALDYLYSEMTRKPAACVAYGGVGGARAVEHLRLIAVELQMAPVRSAVHIGLFELRALMRDGSFEDYPYLGDSAKTMLDDIVWWSNTLRAGRTA
tara:strand:+ start:3500 stop:4072 length:573 start_codon:yes stop_codon:yes gene_type:complete